MMNLSEPGGIFQRIHIRPATGKGNRAAGVFLEEPARPGVAGELEKLGEVGAVKDTRRPERLTVVRRHDASGLPRVKKRRK